MLAAHLSRINRPVRYAMPPQMDPELAQSVRNYLALTLRGANVPRLHHQAQGVLQPFYQQHPGAREHFHGLMGEHDPAALLQYLDMLAEHGGEYGLSPLTLSPDQLISHAMASQQGHGNAFPHFDLLGHLHNTARPLQGDLMGQNSPVRAFSPGQLRSPGLIATMRSQLASRPDPVTTHRDILNYLREAQGYHGYSLTAPSPYSRTLDDLDEQGHAELLPHLYDHLQRARQETQRNTAGRQAIDVGQQHISNIIRQHVIPHLYENQP